MSTLEKNEKSVSHSTFVSLLTKEAALMKNHGTTYRQKTAELSLNIAKKEKNPQSFLKRDKAYKVVCSYLTDEPEERLKDVTKYLHFLYLHLYFKDEVTTKVKKEHTKRKKSFQLIPVN